MLLLFFLLLVVPLRVSTQTFGDCERKSCRSGSGPNISFPFWIVGRHQPYCGHHLFKVNCSGDSTTINLSDNTYVIQNISYDTKSFNLSRAQPQADNNGNCSFPSRNTTFVDTFFHPSDGWLRFHTGCNVSAESCIGRDGKVEHYVVEVWREGGFGGNCNGSVQYPKTNGWTDDRSGGQDVLNQSFSLNWMGLDCGDCQSSGGECGYNENRTSTMCICADRVHLRKCKKGTIDRSHDI